MRLLNPLRSVVIPLQLALAVHLSAQVMKREPKEGMFSITLEVKGPTPLFELPANIPSEAGAATCHAQVIALPAGEIPLYLINRTEKKTSIYLHGLDIGLRARRKLDNGKWERVQPANGWAMCGDSMNELAIPPGMFIRVLVSSPPSGTPATLRYQLGNQWLSNEFQGFFIPEARDQAQRDLKSEMDCPDWAHVLKLSFAGPESPDYWPPLSPSQSELSSEERFSNQAAAIELLQQYADFHAARMACDDALSAIHLLPKPLAEAASTRFSQLKSRPAVAAATDAEFAARCLGYLRTKPAGPAYGHPSQHPGMCWKALAWLGGNSPDSAALPWTEIFALWKERIPHASLPELSGMAGFLERSRLANEHVSGEILISLLKSEYPAMRENAVKLLLERNMDRALAEAAASLDEPGKSIVIRQVASDQKRFSMGHGPLNDFLIACAEANPEATFEAIDETTEFDKPVDLEPGLSLAFGDFFKRTVSVGLEGPVKIEDYQVASRIRRCMRYVQNRALLKKLADSQAYEADKNDAPVAERRLTVAREARRQWALLRYEP